MDSSIKENVKCNKNPSTKYPGTLEHYEKSQSINNRNKEGEEIQIKGTKIFPTKL